MKLSAITEAGSCGYLSDLWGLFVFPDNTVRGGQQPLDREQCGVTADMLPLGGRTRACGGPVHPLNIRDSEKVCFCHWASSPPQNTNSTLTRSVSSHVKWAVMVLFWWLAHVPPSVAFLNVFSRQTAEIRTGGSEVIFPSWTSTAALRNFLLIIVRFACLTLFTWKQTVTLTRAHGRCRGNLNLKVSENDQKGIKMTSQIKTNQTMSWNRS